MVADCDAAEALLLCMVQGGEPGYVGQIEVLAFVVRFFYSLARRSSAMRRVSSCLAKQKRTIPDS